VIAGSERRGGRKPAAASPLASTMSSCGPFSTLRILGDGLVTRFGMLRGVQYLFKMLMGERANSMPVIFDPSDLSAKKIHWDSSLERNNCS
jgi:hypothetical protein